jgi:hypothetical protein
VRLFGHPWPGEHHHAKDVLEYVTPRRSPDQKNAVEKVTADDDPHQGRGHRLPALRYRADVDRSSTSTTTPGCPPTTNLINDFLGAGRSTQRARCRRRERSSLPRRPCDECKRKRCRAFRAAPALRSTSIRPVQIEQGDLPGTGNALAAGPSAQRQPAVPGMMADWRRCSTGRFDAQRIGFGIQDRDKESQMNERTSSR